MRKHIIAALLCIIVMCYRWHDARILLPLLPYLVALIRIMISDTRRLMEVDMDE